MAGSEDEVEGGGTVLVCGNRACGARFSVLGYRPPEARVCPACGGALVPLGSTVAEPGGVSTMVEAPATSRASSRGASEGASGSASFGRFSGARVLARGGMGVILRAVDPELGREVAIKVVGSRGSASDALLARFVREAKIAGCLEHPSIAPVYERGRTPEGEDYFAMKLVRGRSLAEILAELRDAAPAADSAAVRRRLLSEFLKVCDAVAYAHSRGVIHRDLKPANVMIGEFGEVQVMDWGLARVRNADGGSRMEETKEAGEAARRTQAGAILGTPAYMSPEQADGAVDLVDERSDVYSLGAVLYEILSFTPPYRGTTRVEVLSERAHGPLDPPSSRAPAAAIPRELDAVVLKAMADGPGDRYQRVEELRAEVEAFLAGRALAAAEYAPWEILVKWVRRNRARALGTAATIAAILAGAGGAWVAARSARARGEEEERAARAAEGERRHDEGLAAWREASARAPFNPAAPQEHFQAHLSAASSLAGGIQTHPDPPAEWREELARLAGELQGRAQDVSDWALARILVELAAAWTVVGEEEKGERLALVRAAEEQAAASDRRRLDGILERIRRAEAGEKEGALVPGEIEERARRLARAPGSALTREVLARLARGEGSGTARIFLIEVLGRRGDVRSQEGGTDAPGLVREALSSALSPGGSASGDELAAWILAAARLASRAPVAFGDLDSVLQELALGPASVGPAAAAIARARSPLSRPLPGAGPPVPPLPSPSADPVAFRTRIEELADWAAASAESGAGYARYLLALAREDQGLTDHAVAFVYDELGLLGNALPPDPDRPEVAAIPVLTAAFEALPPEWLPDRRPEGADPAVWQRARTKAIAAAANLSRLGDPGFATALSERRERCPFTEFWIRTKIPFVLLDLSGWAEPRTVLEFLDRGRARLDHGDLQGALADYTNATRLDPARAEAWGNLANVKVEMGDREGALEDYARAIDLRPTSAVLRSNRGNVRWEMGKLDLAIEDFTKAIELAPAFALAYSNRGGARNQKGDASGAIEDFTRAIELDPRQALWYFNRGVPREALRDFEGALSDYSKAIELHPEHVFSYHNRGNLRRKMGDRAGAIEDLTRAIRLDPTGASAYADRAIVRAEQGDMGGAIEDCDEALARDSRYAIAYRVRGDARIVLGERLAAIDDYTRVLEIVPDDAVALANRGGARYELGLYETALGDLARVVELDPSSWNAWAGQAMALARLGRREDSALSFDKALALCPLDHKERIESARRELLGR